LPVGLWRGAQCTSIGRLISPRRCTSSLARLLVEVGPRSRGLAIYLVDKQMQRNEVAELGVLSQFEFTDFVVPVTATLVALAGMIAWTSSGSADADEAIGELVGPEEDAEAY
jgi:hypothetical protein